MAVAAETGALAAEFDLIAEGDVDDAALAAVHGVEAEGLGGALHLLGGGGGAEAEFGDAQHAEIVRVEGEARMIVVGNAERFHGDVLQSEEQLGLVGEEQFDVGAFEFDDDLGVLDLRIAGIAGFDLILDVEVGVVEDHVEELFYARAYRINGVFRFAQISLPGARIPGWGKRAARIGRGKGLIEEPLLRNAHEVASEPV